MFNFRAALVCLSLLTGWVAPAIGAEALSLADKASLQAAMQRYVDSQSVDGALLYLDPATGDVRALHPVTAHPMILSMAPHFVLCFDFRDDQGKDVPVDFYMAKKAAGYSVFHTAVADRDLLRKLMDTGRVRNLP